MSGSHNNQLLPPNWNKTSKLRQEKIAKRLAENGSKSKTLDIDSIRARRARLEALTKSMRSPTNDKRSSSMVPSAKNVKLSPIGTPSPNKLDKKRRDDVLLKKAKPSTDKSDPKSSSKYEEELLAKWKRERVIGDDSRRSSIKEYTDDEEPKEEEEEDDAEEEEEEEDEEEDEDEESEDYDSRSSTTYGDTSSNDGSMLEQPTEKTVRDIVKQIKARTEDERLMGVYRARKHLSIETEPPFDIYINAGIIGPLVSCLSTYNPNLQFEAAWALTNIASGSSEHAMALYEGGAVPELIILLNSPYNRVSDQCVWALGNLAGDSDFLWQVVVEEGAIRPLYNLIEKSPSLASLRNLSWAFSNILRHKPLSLSHSDFVLCLKAVRLFLHHPDKEIHLNGCWSLVYITDNGNDKIEDVLKAGVLPRIVEELLDTNDKKTVTPAIRVLGNIMTGTDEQTEQVVNSGVVPILVRHLDHPSCNIRKDCAWALSNITAGTEDQIQTVIDADALQQLKVVINTQTRWSHPRVRLHSPKPEVNTTTEQLIHGSRHTDDSGVKKEAVWCVSNLTQSGNQKQVDEVIHTDLLAAMVNSIKKKGEVGKQQLHVTFEGINNVLEKTSHPKKAARIILKSLPLKDIEGYTYDSEKRIAAVAAKLHLSLSEHSDEH